MRYQLEVTLVRCFQAHFENFIVPRDLQKTVHKTLAAIATLPPHSMQVEKNGIVSQHDCSRLAIFYGRGNRQRTLACSTQWRKKAFQNSITE